MKHWFHSKCQSKSVYEANLISTVYMNSRSDQNIHQIRHELHADEVVLMTERMSRCTENQSMMIINRNIDASKHTVVTKTTSLS